MTTGRFSPIRQGLSVAGIPKAAVDNLEQLLRPRGQTVAQLADPAQAGANARGFVTDATSAVFNDVVVGLGTNRVPVFCTGTDWRIG